MNIIHQVKTKKNTTVKGVGYPVLISIDFDFSVYSLVFVLFEKIYHTLIGYSNNSNFVKNTSVSTFNFLLNVWKSR